MPKREYLQICEMQKEKHPQQFECESEEFCQQGYDKTAAGAVSVNYMQVCRKVVFLLYTCLKTQQGSTSLEVQLCNQSEKQSILGLSLTCSLYRKFSSRHKGSCLHQILSLFPKLCFSWKIKGDKGRVLQHSQ